MSWASLLKAGGKAVKWAGRGAGRVLETGGKALLHPQQTLKGAGTAIKSVAVGGGLGYVGWKKITTDESVVGIVSDAIIGEKATQKVSDTVHGAVEGVRDLKESFGAMTEKVSCPARLRMWTGSSTASAASSPTSPPATVARCSAGSSRT